eukprot:TRINITY_DN8470_c0_g1_i2.p1 TRINITY_DN8470_c0_g1~~TRINITY_DN8470_c0_g1_i2.p1  ORF type:complete len:120 (+),score=23.79 TRINITY_DN8470_c0_g1_i2:3-362(+)
MMLSTLCDYLVVSVSCFLVPHPSPIRLVHPGFFFFFLMIRRPPRSTHCISSAASDVYKRQYPYSVHYQISYNCFNEPFAVCLLYTSDAADDMQCVDLGGRRIIKKKKKKPGCTRRIGDG